MYFKFLNCAPASFRPSFECSRGALTDSPFGIQAIDRLPDRLTLATAIRDGSRFCPALFRSLFFSSSLLTFFFPLFFSISLEKNRRFATNVSCLLLLRLPQTSSMIILNYSIHMRSTNVQYITSQHKTSCSSSKRIFFNTPSFYGHCSSAISLTFIISFLKWGEVVSCCRHAH